MAKASRHRHWSWAFFLLGIAAVHGVGQSAAEEAPEAREILEQMGEALRRHSYDGTFVYTREGVMETLRIVRSADGERGRERIYALSGRAWEVFRGADQALTVMGGESDAGSAHLPALAGIAFRRGKPRVDGDLGEHYRITLVGEDRLADRAAWVVAIEPTDRLRYGHRFWIDQETHLPLQAQVRDGEEVLERLFCTRLEVGDTVTERRLESQLKLSPAVRERLGRAGGNTVESGPTTWRVVNLPPGFRLAMEGRFQAPELEGEGGDAAVEHLLFSDGLAHVSVYVVRQEEGRAGRMRLGSLHAVERPVNGYQMTVLGDVPPETVERFADGVRRR